MYQPLEIPPGVYRNGTDLQSAGRWRDVSLVRWKEGAMQPVGGWSERMDFTSGIYRGAISWQDNSGDRWLAVGSHNALKVSTRSGLEYDITPVGLTAGIVDSAQNTGYGSGTYNTGAYGTARSGTDYSEATSWSLDTWGEHLIACNPADGNIYEWQLNTATPAAAVSGAPTSCLGAHVTYERFLFALGAGGDPRKVQWCDREDNTTWTPAATNEAGDYVLESDNQIMCATSVPGQTLILTETEAFVANYVGPPFVYGFEKVGSSCGVKSRKAVAGVDSGAIWMGDGVFYSYYGSGVEPVACEVSDYVFNDINPSQESKVWAWNNAQFDEVWWFYPSSTSTECDKYVAYNYREKHWMTGDLARTTGVDRGVMEYPILLGTDSAGYDHERGIVPSGTDVYAESGPVVLGAGVVSVTSMIPDEKTQGDVDITVKSRFHPNDTETTHGPYSAANPTDMRLTGRQVRLRVDRSVIANWRWGLPRVLVAQRGRR